MASIFLQLNRHKKYYNKILKNNQETNTTSDKLEDKTKSSLIQHHTINNNINKRVRNNYYLKRYENYFHKKLVIKYNVLPQEYNQMQLENFIIAKYCHNLASFKENLIYYDNNEFLKNYYRIKIIKKELPRLIDFYQNYLNFFCFPTFTEMKLNDYIEEIIEKKAKAFYSENYKDDEYKNNYKNNKHINNCTIIFTKKIKSELSRSDTLIGLSKTTIKNKESDKNSLTSINTINKIIDNLYENKKTKNLSIIKLNKNNYLTLLNKEENNECKTERIKDIEMANNFAMTGAIISKNYSISSTDRNYKKNIININKNLEKDMKNKINNKYKLTKLMNNQKLIKKLNQQNNFIKKRINNTKKTSQNKCIKEDKKINNKHLNNLHKEKSEDNKKSKNNKTKINKNNIVIKLINFENLKKIKSNIGNKNEKGSGNKTTREKKFRSIKNLNNNNGKIKLVKFDQKFQSFLNIALNFNKSPRKKRLNLCFKKPNNKQSNISLSDRNKSYKLNKLRNKININSYINNNLTEYIKKSIKKDSIKKNSITKIINKQKKFKPISRNYKIGFDNIKTTIIKTTIRNTLNNKILYNTKTINISSKKKLNNKINKIQKIKANIKNNKNKHKRVNTKKENNTFIQKKRCHLTSSNLSQISLNSKHKKTKAKIRTFNLKKYLLTINRLITRTTNSSKNLGKKKQKSLNELKIYNI